MPDIEKNEHRDWRHSLAVYTDRRVLMILPLSFSSGLPYLLTLTTVSAWLATVGIKRSAIGVFALVGTPYAFKFLWSPLIDRLPPPLPLGRRRGWGVTIQLLLIAALVAMGMSDPKHHLYSMGLLAVTVAFLSASQDIVIDAWRVEMLPPDLQGAAGGVYITGYRIAMLVAGAGTLLIADRAGWFAGYATMAVLESVGMLVFLFGPEPVVSPMVAFDKARTGFAAIRDKFATAVAGPFADFMRRPLWLAILIFVVGYKLGEGMLVVMATPFYISLGFTLTEIATMSKLVGFFATVIGALLGGLATARLGIPRSLLVCGIFQALGNLAFVLQAVEGHRLGYLAVCVSAENITAGMAGTALIAYLSSLCSPAYTATQYALLASLAVVGRTLVASLSGVLTDAVGWIGFFLITTVVTIPSLVLIPWIARRSASAPEQSLVPASD